MKEALLVVVVWALPAIIAIPPICIECDGGMTRKRAAKLFFWPITVLVYVALGVRDVFADLGEPEEDEGEKP